MLEFKLFLILHLFCVQLFIKSNQGDEETTKVNYLTFIGTPVQATNMNDFKRVRNERYPTLSDHQHSVITVSG